MNVLSDSNTEREEFFALLLWAREAKLSGGGPQSVFGMVEVHVGLGQ